MEKKENKSVEAADSIGVIDSSFYQKADEFVTTLLQLREEDFISRREKAETVDSLGREIQRRAANESRLLKQPVKKLANAGGEALTKDLVNLKAKVQEIDPSRFNFSITGFRKVLGKFLGTPTKRYFIKYESAQTIINSIVGALEDGKGELYRDNITLIEDQKRMRETTKRLKDTAKLAIAMDEKLQEKLDSGISEEQLQFVQNEIMFPLRQRILDLQQQLMVNQQGILTSEMIIRNNKELMRGVNRVINVTISALEIGVAVTMALANQKSVIDNIDIISKTTANVLAGTASRLKTQGVAIQKQATSTAIDIDTIKSAFSDILAAFDDVATFRKEALPQMAQQITELNNLSEQAEKEMIEVERINKKINTKLLSEMNA